MSNAYYNTVELIGPYEIVSKCKELLIQDMLCANCVEHHPKKSVLDADDIWHLTYWFETNWAADREVVARLLDSLQNGVYPSLKVKWISLEEWDGSSDLEDEPPKVLFSFPSA